MRLFLAIDPPPACRGWLGSLIEGLREVTTAWRWSKPGQLHVTLHFMGNVPDGNVAPIVDAVRSAVAAHAPFTAVLAGAGVFPDWRQARVAWVGFQGADAMHRLAADVGAACAAHGYPPGRLFRAHLTLGRAKHALSPVERLALRAAFDTFTTTHPFEVSRVVLYRSDPSPAGSRYTEVASFPLGGA